MNAFRFVAEWPSYGQFLLAILITTGLAFLVSRLVARTFFWRMWLCSFFVVVSLLIVNRAGVAYVDGEGGFKLGVDLVGGTVLVYEVDPDRQAPKIPGSSDPNAVPGSAGAEGFDIAKLCETLKRRIDPADLYNVTIRPVGSNRVEIILPTGGEHQSRIEEENWQKVLAQTAEKFGLSQDSIDTPRGRPGDLVLNVARELDKIAWKNRLDELKTKYPKLKDAKLDELPVGNTAKLQETIKPLLTDVKEKELTEAVQFTSANVDEIRKFVTQVYDQSGRKREATAGDVERIKELIKQAGNLSFQILANEDDDRQALQAARDYFLQAQKDPALKEEIERAAREGRAPPFPTGDYFTESDRTRRKAAYAWVELGKSERKQLGLHNAGEGGPLWQSAAIARAAGTAFESGMSRTLLFSRDCKNRKMTEEERQAKKYEYFFLVCASDNVTVDGKNVTVSASSGTDDRLNPSVNFRFNGEGGRQFYDVTSKNVPSGEFKRHLAIILDDMIVSAPSLNSAISDNGQITGNFTQNEVNNLVGILNSGALPATLKPLPVSENTIGPTLGADTITKGVRSVGGAFLAVLVFMMFYYRFAGFVASVALLANLLLTVAFMVAVNATFTLPGLAGLVLMLGIAVDANVLIYERVREEQDRKASVAMAIRNGYEKAFPVIIDTHLSSMFTAAVLWAVGNDQLKGFGISLFWGLAISLFTSLVMTRFIFDIWLHQRWLTQLKMLRLFSRPNIDFMRVRQYWFTATIVLTLFGITVFLVRGKNGLNIDFVGGTAYTGMLRSGEARDMEKLRELLAKKRQDELLQVRSVRQTDEAGFQFEIVYAQPGPSGDTVQVTLTNEPESWKSLPRADREQAVAARAAVLPDWSVEQLFLSNDPESVGGRSRVFNIRTTEKEAELVQVTIDRLLSEEQAGRRVSLLQKTELKQIDVKGKQATLVFSDFASPGYVKTLMEREFQAKGANPQFDVNGEGKNQEGRYTQMVVDVTATRINAEGTPEFDEKLFQQVLASTKQAFETRPQPLRLENFDPQLAADTSVRAMYAILASWAAILMYLWFRFGNWTFGLATVLCLFHDIFFTLGLIAFCHYVVAYLPWLATILLLEDFKIDLTTLAALLTLVGYSVNDKIVVFERIKEVRGRNPLLTAQMINDSINQTLSRTILSATTVFLVVAVLYVFGGEGVHLFAFVMVVGVVIGTYSSIYIASPLLLILGEGTPPVPREPRPVPVPETVA